MSYGNPRQNLLQQYLEYWNSLAHFDFGLSVSHYPTPVWDDLAAPAFGLLRTRWGGARRAPPPPPPPPAT
jgi:hypothetical protein